MTVRKELQDIHTKSGGVLDPASVVRWAKKNPKSKLYNQFDWDNTKAAHKWRLHQARNLILEIRYVADPSHREYVSLSFIESTSASLGYENRELLMRSRPHDLQAAVWRQLKAIRELNGDMKPLEKIWREIDALERKYDEPEQARSGATRPSLAGRSKTKQARQGPGRLGRA